MWSVESDDPNLAAILERLVEVRKGNTLVRGPCLGRGGGGWRPAAPGGSDPCSVPPAARGGAASGLVRAREIWDGQLWLLLSLMLGLDSLLEVGRSGLWAFARWFCEGESVAAVRAAAAELGLWVCALRWRLSALGTALAAPEANNLRPVQTLQPAPASRRWNAGPASAGRTGEWLGRRLLKLTKRILQSLLWRLRLPNSPKEEHGGGGVDLRALGWVPGLGDAGLLPWASVLFSCSGVVSYKGSWLPSAFNLVLLVNPCLTLPWKHRGRQGSPRKLTELSSSLPFCPRRAPRKRCPPKRKMKRCRR